jgi:putative transposase
VRRHTQEFPASLQRGNNRQTIFAAEADYQFFRDALVEAAGRFGLAIHGYVWMTNHIHLLASPLYADSIGKTLQSVGRRYVQYFNYTYKRTGTLWEGRYRATVVDSESYLLKLMHYIDMNPVRASMVSHPRAYAWSSFRRYADGDAGLNSIWLEPHQQYLALGSTDEDRRVAYRQLFKTITPEDELTTVRDATNKGWALGSDRFAAEIEVLSERRAVSKGRGRHADACNGEQRVRSNLDSSRWMNLHQICKSRSGLCSGTKQCSSFFQRQQWG